MSLEELKKKMDDAECAYDDACNQTSIARSAERGFAEKFAAAQEAYESAFQEAEEAKEEATTAQEENE